MKKTRTITTPAMPAESRTEAYHECDVCGKADARRSCVICGRDVCESWQCRATDPEDYSDYPATWCQICKGWWEKEFASRIADVVGECDERIAAIQEEWRARSLDR